MHKSVAKHFPVAILIVSLFALSALLHAATSNRLADVVQTSRENFASRLFTTAA